MFILKCALKLVLKNTLYYDARSKKHQIVQRFMLQVTLWSTRVECWIPKAIHTHTQYVILTAFPLQKWLLEGASTLRYKYIACLVFIYVCCHLKFIVMTFNHLTPNDHFSGRTAPLTSRCFILLFIQQTYVLNILNMLHTLCFFPLKMPFIS